MILFGRKAKEGFTLMELMVYIAIAGIVALIAGQAFSNSTNFRIRIDNMVKANQEAENIATIFKDDVEQLGTKSAQGAGNSFVTVSNKIYMDPANADNSKKDSSSFSITQDADGFSDLTFRRTRYDDEGHYQAIESIHWYVEDHILKRSCSILERADGYTLPNDDPCAASGDNKEPTPVDMATGVSEFSVEAARPGTTEDAAIMFPKDGSDRFLLYPRTDASVEYGKNFTGFHLDILDEGSSIMLSQFWANYENKEDNLDDAILTAGLQKVNQGIALGWTETLESNWEENCLKYGALTFKPDTVYELSFEITSQASKDRSSNFVPGKDHMSVGFRQSTTKDYAKKGTTIILPDFLFYPPLDNNMGDGAGKRVMRFTVPEKVENVCIAFTFAFYSPLAALGQVTIKDLKVKQVATANYKFDHFNTEDASNIREKKNVKALKLKLQVSRGVKNGVKGETGDINMVIPIPSNGTGD